MDRKKNTIQKLELTRNELGIKNFIQNINSKYYLKIGEKAFSPIIQISSFLVLKYLDDFNKTTDKNLFPFFFSFPVKKSASVWLSICLLTNYFNEDYYESEGKAVQNLKIGEKYTVYGSVGKYLGKITDQDELKLRFKFKDGTKYCKNNVRSIIQDVKQSRELNKANHYSKRKRDAKKYRSAISKILEPTEGIIINEQVLTSKILLVTGRGNAGSIKELINVCEIFDEPISKIYSPNDNIILKPDLKDYRTFFEQNHQQKINEFLNWIDRLVQDSNLDVEVLNSLIEIKSSIDKEGIITSEINNQFSIIIEEYSDIEPRLQKLNDNFYPGITVVLPENLKAVIVNDISQIEDYPATIKGFLQKRIPVIIVSNRGIQKPSDLSFYSRLFDSEDGIWKDAYRINWNRSKISALNRAINPDHEFMDNVLWEACRKYARQIIKIDISQEPNGFNLDEKIRLVLQMINDLEGFENLKTAFFQYLYPLLYAFKNSHFIDVDYSVNILIEKFKEEWSNSKNYLPKNIELVEEIEAVINQLECGKFENSKPLSTQNIFSSSLSIPDYGQLNIPVGSQTNLPNQETKKMVFTGFPYREFSGKYLQNACLNYFVPEINVHCWPYEGRLTFNYLIRRIESGYFLDNIPDNTSLPEELILNNQTKIENEINTTLEVNNIVGIKEEETIQTENDLISLDNFQYEKYKYVEHDSDKFKYIVKCNIVRFHDGGFMFLPQQSKILSELENEAGQIAVKKLKFNELSVGLRVFNFSKEQVNYSEILQDNQELEKANSDLKRWRQTLSRLAKELGTIQKLYQFLVSVANESNISDANPEILNLRRWLNDEDLIAPNKDNMRVIFLAGKKRNIIQDNIEEVTECTLKAYKFIKSAHISLGHKIKSAIASQLKRDTNKGNEFSIKVNDDMEVSIVAKKIAELQPNDIEVEYHETRKYLC